jgi:hypothetical protein
MTTTYAPSRDIPKLTVIEPAPVQDRVAVRCEALVALDSFVRPLLTEKVQLPMLFGRPTVELTIYDEVYRRTRAGGHWTVNSRLIGWLTHTIAGYTVELHFDDEDRPSHFVISGAQKVVTDDASPEALGRGLEAAVRGGPLITWAPNFPPDISL